MEVIKRFVEKLDAEAERRKELTMLGNRHERRQQQSIESGKRRKRRLRATA